MTRQKPVPPEGAQRVLAVVPYLPARGAAGASGRLRGLLEGLAAESSLTVLAAGPDPAAARGLERLARPPLVLGESELLAAARRAALESSCDVLLFADWPEARPVLEGLRVELRLLSVLVTDEEPLSGLSSPEPGRPCLPRELWSLGARVSPLRTAGLMPCSVHAAGSAGRAWLRERLAALRQPPRPAAPKGLTSIIIPVWNQVRYTRECLASVARWTSAPHEVIVVDNGSTDGTPKLLESLAETMPLRVIRNEANLGFAKAVNQGMRAAKGEYLLWLNNDAVAAPGWLERLIGCLERAPWVGAVGPVTNECEGPQRLAGAGSMKGSEIPAFARALAFGYAWRTSLVHRLIGFCLLTRRSTVERVGMLDESFGRGCYEDFDFCLRLRQASYELAIAEDAFVYHHGHKSFASDAAMRAQAAENRELFVRKWCRSGLEFLDELDPVQPKDLSAPRRVPRG